MSACHGDCYQGRLCTCAPTTDHDYADKGWLHPPAPAEKRRLRITFVLIGAFWLGLIVMAVLE